MIFSFKNKKISKVNNKLKINFNEIDLRIKEMEPAKIIALSKLM
jgi:hypothetical protein